MDITHQNKLTNTTWAPYNIPMEILNDHQTPFHDHIQWSNNNYPLIQNPSNSTQTQLITLDQTNFKHELADQNHEDQEQDQQEEELGPMKEMMFKIASMQPVDIDPATIRRPKRRNVRISDDPQSVAARHRRERISEKIRILQRLVPGGTKMDTASMLDEAIRYVKFLQKQIRLLQSNHHHQPPFATATLAEDWVAAVTTTTTTTTTHPNSSTSYLFGGKNVDNDEVGGHGDFNHNFNFGHDD